MYMPKSKTRKVSPRKQLSKRKRDASDEIRKRETSDERRKRLSSEEAWQRFLNRVDKRDKENRDSKLKLLKKELNKNKNNTMNLLSNGKRKFTFKGLGKRLGTKI